MCLYLTCWVHSGCTVDNDLPKKKHLHQDHLQLLPGKHKGLRHVLSCDSVCFFWERMTLCDWRNLKIQLLTDLSQCSISLGKLPGLLRSGTALVFKASTADSCAVEQSFNLAGTVVLEITPIQLTHRNECFFFVSAVTVGLSQLIQWDWLPWALTLMCYSSFQTNTTGWLDDRGMNVTSLKFVTSTVTEKKRCLSFTAVIQRGCLSSWKWVFHVFLSYTTV